MSVGQDGGDLTYTSPYQGNWSSPGADYTQATVNSVLDGQGSGDARTTQTQTEPYVRRLGKGAAYRTGGHVLDDSGRKVAPTLHAPKTATVSSYQQEFIEKWQDPKFKSWFVSRAVAAGLVSNPATASIDDYWTAWNAVGTKAASMPGWSGTPEQLLEFMASGKQFGPDSVKSAIAKGEALIDPLTGQPYGNASGVTAAAVNPIQTSTSTSYASINPLAARSAINDLSKALLGRMATNAEIARYRKAMNGILKSHPTVTTTTTDATDPNNVKTSSSTKDGASATDAVNAMQDRVEQSSEGRAFGVGKAFEEALRMMGN